MEDRAVQLHLLLTFDVTCELAEDTLRCPRVVQTPDKLAAQVAPIEILIHMGDGEGGHGKADVEREVA